MVSCRDWAKDWSAVLFNLASVIALGIAGWWAYHQFSITETAAGNIQLTVASEVIKYSDKQRLLVIHVKPRNIGKTLVTPENKGFLVEVRKIPSGAPVGPLDLKKLPVSYKTDLMERFSDGYELEPGVEYDEIVVLVVPVGTMYAVRSELNLGDNTEVDHTAVVHVD